MDIAPTPIPETSGLGEIPVQISGIQSTLTRRGNIGCRQYGMVIEASEIYSHHLVTTLRQFHLKFDSFNVKCHLPFRAVKILRAVPCAVACD